MTALGFPSILKVYLILDCEEKKKKRKTHFAEVRSLFSMAGLFSNSSQQTIHYTFHITYISFHETTDCLIKQLSNINYTNIKTILIAYIINEMEQKNNQFTQEFHIRVSYYIAICFMHAKEKKNL